ncbi:hypothetical protein AWC38_SpisGene16700 [Stylophora pistillata]|uniref:Uncharacterized protein n=1 Tax=Stylophora pistillata TaxID=50429 RepID=A0A2B4RQ30_STYPI|nr:hypothetical protein AWC38_SpisGene16700 [Stylophora pistillata]
MMLAIPRSTFAEASLPPIGLVSDLIDCLVTLLSKINGASTALGLFEKGVNEYGLPLCVRGDDGMENIDAASQKSYLGMRTTGHHSPLALWNMSLLQTSDAAEVLDIESYGIDQDGPIPDIITDNNVVVPELELELTESENQQLKENVDPLSDDGNSGINHFLSVLQILETFQ